MLPLPIAITTQLDKASVVRLATSYLKLREFSANGDPRWRREAPPSIKSVRGELSEADFLVIDDIKEKPISKQKLKTKQYNPVCPSVSLLEEKKPLENLHVSGELSRAIQ